MSESAQPRWDREAGWIAVFAACASVLSFLIYFRRGEILLFGDAVAHINIARRVFDSRTPGPLQLGTVWLPLPHLLMMPLLVSKWGWRTGVGGSIPSMVTYVLGVLGVYRLTRGVTQPLLPGFSQRWPSCLATAIYGLNPNLLYLQATAMTESLYLALFVWAVVHCSEFLAASEAGRKCSLWKCGFCLAGASFTRYDGWFVTAAAAGLVMVSAWRDPSRVKRRLALKFVLLTSAAPIFWFAYNGVIYRNPLEFANGPYSARAIEKKTAVPGLPPHPGTNNLPAAAAYFLKAGLSNVAERSWQAAWLLLALVGTFVAIRGRQSAAILLWSSLPFYMLSVAYGGVPIFTPNWWPHSFYNIRYGVQLLPALAVFLPLPPAYLASRFPANAAQRVVAFLAIGFVVLSYASVWRATPVAYREAWVNSRTRLQLESQLAEKLRQLPPDSTFLMYLGDHVGALQMAGLPLRRSINEGNHRVWKQPSDPEGLWERALADPSQYADFIVTSEGDAVWQAVHLRTFPVFAKIEVSGQRPVTIYLTR
jgi:4-amino-4-deoxy-L-arabinose transferase-like glycosyltransferase